jgi:hypothetical protein
MRQNNFNTFNNRFQTKKNNYLLFLRLKAIHNFIRFKQADAMRIKNETIKINNLIKNEEETNNIINGTNNFQLVETNSNIICKRDENDKILVLISCHTDNLMRLDAIRRIMVYLRNVENIDIIIVNTKDAPFSNMVCNKYKDRYLQYYEIPNDNFFGFSKWYYGLIHSNFMNYKFVTFINDSFLIHNDITHFFEHTRYKNVDFYGYNDSTQVVPHYQSYLFSIKNTAIPKFIQMFHDKKKFINSYMDAVYHYELQMFNYFPDHDCFLKIGNLPFHRGKNIFAQNDLLYIPLRNSGLLPFTKLKRII